MFERLLLDTHVLLWWGAEEPALPARADAAIRRAPVVMISMASAWEIAIKVSRGRLKLAMGVGQMVEVGGFEMLPVTLDHADEVARLPFHHRDPFDRMLVAQARVERLSLVTNDRSLEAYDVPTIWT